MAYDLHRPPRCFADKMMIFLCYVIYLLFVLATVHMCSCSNFGYKPIINTDDCIETCKPYLEMSPQFEIYSESYYSGNILVYKCDCQTYKKYVIIDNKEEK